MFLFNRSSTDKRRVRIVDYAHMAWSYAHGNATPLSCMLEVNGVKQMVDTTIPAYTIKALHRYAKEGAYPLVVCFDSRGCSACRKVYFSKIFGVDEKLDGKGYKARREVPDGKFFDGINMTMEFLHKAGITVLRGEHYEADDLIKASVDAAKRMYPELPIDIITGDHDLVPLVDEQVSVFLRSVKTTWAESKDIEIPHYVQITPKNYQEHLEGLSCYKTSKLRIPYNTVLLAKLLRGDKSDEVPGKADWKPKMYNQLVDILTQNEDIANLFVYDAPTKTVVYRSSMQPVPANLIASTPREQMAVVYGEPPALTRICEVLGKYCEPEDLSHVRNIYNGINLNGAFTGLPEGFNRNPAVVTSEIKGYSPIALQAAVERLQIRIPNI